MSTVAKMSSKTSDERYSPPWIVEGARTVMGTIDLDPARRRACQHDRQGEQVLLAEGRRPCPTLVRQRVSQRAVRCQVAWIKKLAYELAQNRVPQVVMVYNVHGLGMVIDRCPQLVRGSILLPYRRPAFFDPATGKTVGTPFSTLLLYYGSRQPWRLPACSAARASSCGR